MNQLRHVLLVDDDPNDIELTLMALEDFKLANEIIVTQDGAEALDYLHRRGEFAGRTKELPVVVLLDLKMPKVNGIEVLREIKSDDQLKTIPVVILTSSKEATDLDQCYRLGANAYVVKPVKFMDFINAVREVGAFWAVINEAPKPTVD
jgi:CheY-like chemotaxis protein